MDTQIVYIKRTPWFERNFSIGLPAGMLPFYLERLEGTTVRLEKKLLGVNDKILSYKLEGKWSIKENIGHLAEVSTVILKRLDEIKQGVSPMSPAVFELRADYNSQPLDEVIDYFRIIRSRNLLAYQNVSEVDLHKTSLHPRLKVQMNPVDLALFDAEHDDHHLVRINEILLTLLK